ncbi:unnamed protein product [Cuscuta europaea]|uniref:Uncharacterized protein n=1 Tax=Cuscuta europaea TaxID=41803 RepID=A0A9P0ZR53_CUSEU|nr:unnamed protein product [Cuscuta europaea]
MSSLPLQPLYYPYDNVPILPSDNNYTVPSLSTASPPSGWSLSNIGSFRKAYLVVGVILVLSFLSCIANRMCTKRSITPVSNEGMNNLELGKDEAVNHQPTFMHAV